MHTEFSQNF